MRSLSKPIRLVGYYSAALRRDEDLTRSRLALTIPLLPRPLGPPATRKIFGSCDTTLPPYRSHHRRRDHVDASCSSGAYHDDGRKHRCRGAPRLLVREAPRACRLTASDQRGPCRT